ncbi:hypothetical protein DL765_005080 [Monosporascus sp. GIB2]|nr:hypothetical protein DL765_005080 [Monosporascus sp. GIB2]
MHCPMRLTAHCPALARGASSAKTRRRSTTKNTWPRTTRAPAHCATLPKTTTARRSAEETTVATAAIATGNRTLARLRREVDVAGGFVLVSKKQLALYARRYHAYGGDVYDPHGAHAFALAAQLRRETRRLAVIRADLDRYVRSQSPGGGGGSSTATPAATAAAQSPLPPLSRNDNNNNKNKAEKRSKTLFAATDAGRRLEERESPDGPYGRR